MTDPSDDAIEGVTLEVLARVGVRLHGTPEDTWDRVAQEHGVPPGRFTAIAEQWTARLSDPATAIRYNDAYQAAMVEAGITAPEITLEQYVDIVKTGGPTQENLAKYGLSLQQFSMVSNGLGQKMAADPALAMRMAELMQSPG